MTRRLLIDFSLALGLLLLSLPEVFAQTDIYIRGSGRLFPIALPQLCLEQGSSSAATDIPQIIAKNLDLSGFFQVVDPAAYLETKGSCIAQDGVAYSDWTVIGADGVVRGVVQEQGNQIRVQLYLHDVLRQRMVLGKEYSGDVSLAPKIAHRFSNEIIKFFTGEEGVFGTQIIYSGRVGRFKELFLMDMDGSNVRQITNDRGLALSPSWDLQGRFAYYTSYRNRVPDIFRVDLMSRRVEQVTKDPVLELGAQDSGDGTFLAARSVGRHSDIVLYDMQGNLQRLVARSSGAINVSPDWSPDRSKITFCSDRGGGPQIYTMNKDGSNVQRVSRVSSSYCTSPVWSPRGDRIAFVCSVERSYQIFVTDVDGGNAIQVTSYGRNEEPNWAPNGHYLVFSSNFGRGSVYNIALVRADGSNLRQITKTDLGAHDPTWGPLN